MKRLGLVLALAAASLSAPAAGQVSVGRSAPQGGGMVSVLGRYLIVADDEALIARDGLLSFPRPFAQEALEVLDDEDELDEGIRAAALMACGAGSLREQRSRLEAQALGGTRALRSAAVLALGELGGEDCAFLYALLEDPVVGRDALVALLRSGSVSARKRILEGFASGGSDRDELMDLMRFVDQPLDYDEVPAEARALYHLRFEAARRFGLVDSQRWEVHLARAVAADERMLDAIVLYAAAAGSEPPVADLLIDRLLRAPDELVLRSAVRGARGPLRALLANELWAPASESQWVALLAELDALGAEPADLPLLEQAAARKERPLVAWRLLAGLGDEGACESLAGVLTDPDALVRASGARGLGASGDLRWSAELRSLTHDPVARVAARALVARARIGDGGAAGELHELLADARRRTERVEVILSLFTDARDPALARFITEAGATSIGPELLLCDAALRRRGDTTRGGELRAAFGHPDAALIGRTMLVETLAVGATPQDLALFAELFPSEEDLAINAVLGAALAQGGQAEGIELLRAGLWRGPWDRSLLAAVVLVRHRGVNFLVAELESAPLGVSADALRRVGYAIGLLGGEAQLELLRRRRSPGDAALQGAYLGALSARTW